MIVDDRHAQLVQFLKDQDMLAAGRGDELLPEAQVFEPVVMTRRENITIDKGARIDSFVKLEGGRGLRVGKFVHIASFAHLGIGGGTTIIEDYAAVASGGKVISGSNQADLAWSMSACAPAHLQRVVPNTTRIGRYACVLTNATVLPGVTLHEGAVLAAGAVATKDIPAWEIWGGVPARFLSMRIKP